MVIDKIYTDNTLMKIAIFGGSFNPVHSEHINIVKAALSSLYLDRVIIMPSCETPNKSGRLSASSQNRLNMCRLAFKGVDAAEVSDYELTQGGISYSYLTCRAIKQKYPHDDLYFIVGADMLENFQQWKNPGEILKCVKLAVCARENEESLLKVIQCFEKAFGQIPVMFNYVGKNVSSTKIRTLCALGESIEGYTDEKVATYIKDNNLYVLPQLLKVKSYLTPERWAHTVRVAIMSAENCQRLKIPEHKAITAAALHDCAKYLKPDSPALAGFTCPEGVPEPVVHQYAGAYVAEHTFGITDKEILEAIRYHTSGKQNMQPLTKLLYLCDMLEDGREFEGVQKLREIFSHSIDDALYFSFEHQVVYLKNAGKPIYPLTLHAYEYVKENKNEQ